MSTAALGSAIVALGERNNPSNSSDDESGNKNRRPTPAPGSEAPSENRNANEQSNLQQESHGERGPERRESVVWCASTAHEGKAIAPGFLTCTQHLAVSACSEAVRVTPIAEVANGHLSSP